MVRTEYLSILSAKSYIRIFAFYYSTFDVGRSMFIFKNNLGFPQPRRHNKYLPQSFFERNCLIGTKPGADPAPKAGAFFPLSNSFRIQGNGIRGAPIHACAAAGAGFLIDHRKMISGIYQGQRTASP